MKPKPKPSPPKSKPPSTPTAAHPRTGVSRKFAVARLPAALRGQVEDMLRDGLPYTKILGFVRTKGHRLSKDALSHWFNRRTLVADESARCAGHTAEAAQAARQLLDADADMLVVLRAIISRELYRRRGEVEQMPVGELLYELRQIARLRPHAPTDTTLSEEEIDRRIRDIYGLTGADDNPHH